jgi:hypothetical protein
LGTTELALSRAPKDWTLVFSGFFRFLPVSPGEITVLGRVLRVVRSLAEPADVVVSAVGDGVHGVDVEVVREDKIVGMLKSSQWMLVVNSCQNRLLQAIYILGESICKVIFLFLGIDGKIRVKNL